MKTDWDSYFMRMAYMVASRSKDESTKFGAVIVTKDQSVVSVGYNSFPRGLNDNVKERQIRPDKYMYFEHAERNAIFNAARIGSTTKDCVMYIQDMPCADCGRAIIQSGIKYVVIHKQWGDRAKEIFGSWQESQKATEIMFTECGVNLIFFNGVVSDDNMKIKTCIRGEWFDV